MFRLVSGLVSVDKSVCWNISALLSHKRFIGFACSERFWPLSSVIWQWSCCFSYSVKTGVSACTPAASLTTGLKCSVTPWSAISEARLGERQMLKCLSVSPGPKPRWCRPTGPCEYIWLPLVCLSQTLVVPSCPLQSQSAFNLLGFIQKK